MSHRSGWSLLGHKKRLGGMRGPGARKRGKVGAGHLQQYRQLIAEASNVKRWNGSGLGTAQHLQHPSTYSNGYVLIRYTNWTYVASIHKVISPKFMCKSAKGNAHH